MRWVCAVCSVPLVTKERWSGMSTEARSGFGQHCGRDLCRTHYDKWRRHGDANYVPRRKSGPDPVRAPVRSRAEVLEDYAMIKDSCGSLAQAAERMGMRTNTLYMALRRAKAAA